MLGDAEVTFTGNLAADPELRFTPSGKAVCSFSVGVTGRKKDPAGGWVDGDVSWHQVTCWAPYAENVAASLRKGDRVTVRGTLSQRSYEKDGEKRYAWEVTAEEVAASLQFAQVQVRKVTRAHEPAA